MWIQISGSLSLPGKKMMILLMNSTHEAVTKYCSGIPTDSELNFMGKN